MFSVSSLRLRVKWELFKVLVIFNGLLIIAIRKWNLDFEYQTNLSTEKQVVSSKENDKEKKSRLPGLSLLSSVTHWCLCLCKSPAAPDTFAVRYNSCWTGTMILDAVLVHVSDGWKQKFGWMVCAKIKRQSGEGFCRWKNGALIYFRTPLTLLLKPFVCPTVAFHTAH